MASRSSTLLFRALSPPPRVRATLRRTNGNPASARQLTTPGVGVYAANPRVGGGGGISLGIRTRVGLPLVSVRHLSVTQPHSSGHGGGNGAGSLAAHLSTSATSNMDGDRDAPVAPPWRDEVLEKHSLLGNVCFVLCGPQGPQNVGSVARVMQNFGVYDLRIVNPGKFVLEGGISLDGDRQLSATRSIGGGSGADDDPIGGGGGGNDDVAFKADGANSRGGVNSGDTLGPDGLGTDVPLPPALQPTLPLSTAGVDNAAGPAVQPLCAEAYRFSCAADWLLADARRCSTTLEALEDCTFVMATTARPRGNMPLVTARAAAEMLAKEAKRGKVAILFGNERTGLTNDELAQAHAAVAIPTAGQGALCRKTLKYTGGTGPTSLNLSQAVGVLAYELFMAADALDAEENGTRQVSSGKIDLPASQLMTVGEKEMLKNELLAARRIFDSKCRTLNPGIRT